MTRRGNWVYHPDTAAGPAWELTGSEWCWWLRRRTGAADSLRWCSYCWTWPYRWWMLYRVPPGQWRTTPVDWWNWRRDWTEEHGHCTHRHDLAGAMAAAERALDKYMSELALRALTAPSGRHSP